MAPRDRNLFAWQVYVITMSFVSLLLLVGVFLLWKSYADTSKIKNDLATQLTTAKDDADKGSKRVKLLKSMLGYGNESADDIKFLMDSLKDDADVGDVQKNFPVDMAVFGANVEKKDYRQFPIYLLDTIRERNTQIDRARQVEQKLTKEKAEVVERETKLREQAVKEKNDAETQLAAAREQHSQNVAKLNGEKDQITALVNKYKQDFEAAISKLKAEYAALDVKAKTLAATNLQLLDKVKQSESVAHGKPAGLVINVANGGRVVWIDIGKADGLVEGVVFNVIDASSTNVDEAKGKARMVVEKVTDAHMAQARVISENYANPVIPGDKVFSPAWRKGSRPGFALVGKMDISGDGGDDRETVRSLIEQSGGRIDSELLPNGDLLINKEKAKGDVPNMGMSSNTSYIVFGTDVKVKKDSVTGDEQSRSALYKKYEGEANILGIRQMNLSNLVDHLQSGSSSRTVPLGKQTRASDFKPQTASGVTPSSNGEVSELFRSRRPATGNQPDNKKN